MQEAVEHLSEQQMQAMTNAQLIAIINRYQGQNRRHLLVRLIERYTTPHILLIVICIVLMSYSNAAGICPAGLCRVKPPAEESIAIIETLDQSGERVNESEMPVAIKTITSEFLSAAKASVDKAKMRYEHMRKLLIEMQKLYQECQQELGACAPRIAVPIAPANVEQGSKEA